MKKLILISIFLIGCSDTEIVIPVCTTEHQKQLSEFIILCAKAANPMSDEEGEDLVKQCEMTGKNIYCPRKKVCLPDGYSINYYKDCDIKK